MANENISLSTKEHIVSGNSTDLKMITYLNDWINDDDDVDNDCWNFQILSIYNFNILILTIVDE